MAFNAPVLTLQLSAGVVAAVAASQSLGGAGNFTLNGSAVTAGVATLSPARRVLFTFAADETGHTFTIVGTDRYGRSQTDTVAGTTVSAYTAKDFLTVTRVASSAATTGNVQIGTNAVGSTAPYIVDTFINPANIGAAIEITGTVTTGLEGSLTDLTPSWDLANNSPVWYSIAGFNPVSTLTQGTITGPFMMIRLTNTSGTGTAKARLVVPFLAGA